VCLAINFSLENAEFLAFLSYPLGTQKGRKLGQLNVKKDENPKNRMKGGWMTRFHQEQVSEDEIKEHWDHIQDLDNRSNHCTILSTQRLSADFCVRWVLWMELDDFSSGNYEDDYYRPTVDTVLDHQKHITREELEESIRRYRETGELMSMAWAGKVKGLLARLDADPTLVDPEEKEGQRLFNICCEHRLYKVVDAMLARGCDLHKEDKYGNDALKDAASSGDAGLCEALIRRGANWLSRNKKGETTDQVYGRAKSGARKLSREQKDRDRRRLSGLFHWLPRWPMMCVMTGCDFRPLAARRLVLEMQHAALAESGELQPPVLLDTSERRRAYYMRVIFLSDGLLRRIVMFL